MEGGRQAGREGSPRPVPTTTTVILEVSGTSDEGENAVEVPFVRPPPSLILA